MKVADLFAGVGGLSQGFIKAGCSIEFAVEFDSAIAEAYQKNHPKTTVYNKDISTLDVTTQVGLSYSYYDETIAA